MIAHVGSASAATTSVTVPVHSIGDYIIITAYRTATTAPTLPAGYTTIAVISGNANSMRIGYKVATATNDASGTWTNATGVSASVYSGVGGIGTDAQAFSHATSTSLASQGLPLDDTSGQSWVMLAMASKATTITTPTGTTQRTSQAITTGLIKVVDSNAGVTSWAAHTATNGATSVYAYGLVELLRANTVPAAPTLSAPANAGTVSTLTPTLNFSTTDANSDDVSYEVQVDTVNTFDSLATAAPVVVQRKSGADTNGGTGSVSVAMTSSVTATNTIIVVGQVANPSNSVLQTPTDTLGNAYKRIGNFQDGANFVGQVWWIANNSSGGANTVNMVDGNFATNMHVFEVSGTVSPIRLDQFASQVQTSTVALSSGNTPATSFANELLIAVMCDDVTGTVYTAGAGYGNLTAQSNTGFSSASEEKTTTSAGVQAATMTIVSTSTVSLSVLMTFAVPNSLIDTRSSTDAGFTDVTNGADTDPFASGNSINYVTQISLTNGVQYFWRVRANDPIGTIATPGAWSTTNSFTVTLGGGTPTPAVSDNITFTEAVQMAIQIQATISDNLTFTESVKAEVNSFITRSDNLTFTENVSVSIVAAGAAAVTTTDSLTFTEAIQLAVPAAISRSDTLTMSEATTLAIQASTSVTDNITFSENVVIQVQGATLPTLQVVVTEGIQNVQGVKIY